MWVIKSTYFTKSSTILKKSRRMRIPVLRQPTTLSQFDLHEHFFSHMRP